MGDHDWELTDAVQADAGQDVIELFWTCTRCGKPWGTFSGVTMPDDEAGECDA